MGQLLSNCMHAWKMISAVDLSTRTQANIKPKLLHEDKLMNCQMIENSYTHQHYCALCILTNDLCAFRTACVNCRVTGATD